MTTSKFNKGIRSAIAAATLMGASSMVSAGVVDKTFTYSCFYPLIDFQDLELNIVTDIPDEIVVGDVAGPYDIAIKAALLGWTHRGLKQAFVDQLEGQAFAAITITGAGNYSKELPIEPVIDKFLVPATDPGEGNWILDLAAVTDPISDFTYENMGIAEIRIKETMSLKLRGFFPEFFPGYPDTTVPFPGFPGADPEDDNAFWVDCTLTDADNLVTTVELIAITHWPFIEVSPTSINFGTLSAGIDTASETVTVSNIGFADLIIDSIALNGDAAITQTNVCSVIAGGDSCDITVTYAPTEGGQHNSELGIRSDDPDEPFISVSLNGSATGPHYAAIQVQDTLELDDTKVGESSTATLTVQSVGFYDLEIAGVTSDDSDFAIDASNCTAAPFSDTCIIEVTFTASADGLDTATLTINSSDGEATVALSAMGIENTGCVIDPSSAACCEEDPTCSIEPCPPECPIPHLGFDITGSTDLAAAKGVAAINGSIEVDFNLYTGTFEAYLALEQTSGLFPFFGPLKALAIIDFVQVGHTTGTLDSQANLTTSSDMWVKLPAVYLSAFGFNVKIAGGDNCGTKEPMHLEMTGFPFLSTVGGDIGGTYTLSTFGQCGLFNSIVSAMVAGEGNTIDLSLMYAP